MPARKKGARVTGPNQHGTGWRYFTCGADGSKTPSKSFTSRSACLAAMAEEQAVIDGRSGVTVEVALGEYELYMREDKGNRQSSIDEIQRRLRRFFHDLGEELDTLTEKRCQALYDRMKEIRSERTGTKASVAWHRNTLITARTFMKWCAKQRYIPTNHLLQVQGTGKVKKGKPQLRIDEARRWLQVAHRLATMGEEGAVAALMTILMGLRASEVVRRTARDVDDNGTRLVIEEAKTAGSNGTFDIPEELQGYLATMCQGKDPGASLWALRHSRKWPTIWVTRICKLAEVPRVTSHGMRGLHGTLAMLGGLGQMQERARQSLRHENWEMSRDAYVDKGVQRALTQGAAEAVIRGREKPPGDA